MNCAGARTPAVMRTLSKRPFGSTVSAQWCHWFSHSPAVSVAHRAQEERGRLGALLLRVHVLARADEAPASGVERREAPFADEEGPAGVAAVFAEAFGDGNAALLVEHHAAFETFRAEVIHEP